MNTPDPFLKYAAGAKAFLVRASEHLEIFESDNSVENFFYAALELRFGIEARLNEYLAATLKSIGKDSKNISDYVASKLLKRLLAINPDAGSESTYQVTNEQSGHSLAWSYTPVTPRLASIHGQLGELLHYKFFTNNKYWYIKKPMGGNPYWSIADYIPLLKEGIHELGKAASGQLLANPRFTKIVEDVADELSNENGNEGSKD